MKENKLTETKLKVYEDKDAKHRNRCTKKKTCTHLEDKRNFSKEKNMQMHINRIYLSKFIFIENEKLISVSNI